MILENLTPHLATFRHLRNLLPSWVSKKPSHNKLWLCSTIGRRCGTFGCTLSRSSRSSWWRYISRRDSSPHLLSLLSCSLIYHRYTYCLVCLCFAIASLATLSLCWPGKGCRARMEGPGDPHKSPPILSLGSVSSFPPQREADGLGQGEGRAWWETWVVKTLFKREK